MKFSRGGEFRLDNQQLLAGRRIPLGMTSAGVQSARPDFMVIGDSHASVMIHVIDNTAKEAGLYGESLARPGQTPFGNLQRGRTEKKVHAMIKQIILDRRPRTVMLIARWSLLFGNDVTTQRVEDNLKTLKSLLAASNEVGATTWIVTQVPEHAMPRSVFNYRHLRAFDDPQRFNMPDITLQEHMQRTQNARHAFRRLQQSGARIIEIDSIFFNDYQRLGFLNEPFPVYWDDNHLSATTARTILTPLFQSLFSELQGGQSDSGKEVH